MPAISVILPTYNRAYCLGRAVGSLLAQTFEDWELILVDDGSTDRTSELRREFASVLGARYRDLDSQRRGASERATLASRRRGASGSRFWTATTSGFPRSWGCNSTRSTQVRRQASATRISSSSTTPTISFIRDTSFRWQWKAASIRNSLKLGTISSPVRP